MKQLKDDMKDWLIPAILLIPHLILLVAIWLSVTESQYLLKETISSAANLATIIGVLIAINALSNWKNQIYFERSIETSEKTTKILKEFSEELEKNSQLKTEEINRYLIKIQNERTKAVIKSEIRENLITVENIITNKISDIRENDTVQKVLAQHSFSADFLKMILGGDDGEYAEKIQIAEKETTEKIKKELNTTGEDRGNEIRRELKDQIDKEINHGITIMNNYFEKN